MILRSIQVENWRCFLTPVTIGPLAEGLNVIHAPNGSGKTTLFEALQRTLLDSCRATGQEIQAVRPWGRSLAPRVCLEFHEDDVCFRLTKQFLQSPSARLERLENGHYVRLAEGSDAEGTVRRMLSGDAPGRRLSKQQDWGMAQVLWAPQGELMLGELSDSLVTDIRDSLNAQIKGPRGLEIQRRIEALYRKYFTFTGKMSTGKGNPLAQLQKDLAAAEGELRFWQGRQEEFVRTAQRVADLRKKGGAANKRLAELQRRLALLSERAASARELASQRKRCLERAEAIQAQLSALAQQMEHTSSLVARVDRGRQALRQLDAEMAQTESRLTLLSAAEAEARSALDRARADQARLAELREKARAASELCEARTDLEKLQSRLDRIREARDAVAKYTSIAAEIVAPDAEGLARIRLAARQRDESQARLDASLLHLELTPEQRGRMEVLVGDSPGEKIVLEPGAVVRVDGSPEVDVEVTGFGRIRAWGPQGSAEEHRDALAEAKDELARLTERFGTDDLASLESLQERARRLAVHVDEAQVKLDALLDGETGASLAQEAESRAATITDLLSRYPEWAERPSDADALAVELGNEEDRCEDTLGDAESVYERAEREADDVRGQKQQLEVRIDQTRLTLLADEEDLAKLLSGQEPLEEQQARVARLGEDLQSAQEQSLQIEEMLGQSGDDVLREIESVDGECQEAEECAREAHEECIREEARLSQMESLAPYSQLVEAEERVDHLRDQVAEEDTRAQAVHLLYHTVLECQDSAFSAVVGEVQSAAEDILGRITGSHIGDLVFGDTFTPQSVVPPVLQEAVPLTNLSGGETEQLYLATRLALAMVLADEHRQMVVLDDVLTATDRIRLGRILDVLEEASERLQVIILTCHADRYERLGSAKVFELEALKEVGLPTPAD